MYPNIPNQHKGEREGDEGGGVKEREEGIKVELGCFRRCIRGCIRGCIRVFQRVYKKA